MKCYEITPESPAYEAAVKTFNINETWKKALPALKELLGVEPESIGLKLAAFALVVKKEPDELKGQFKNGNYGRHSRAKSSIHKKFLEIVKEFGLYSPWDCDISQVLGTWSSRGHESYYPPIQGKYYFETERLIKHMEGLREIKESELLKLWAAELERRESA